MLNYSIILKDAILYIANYLIAELIENPYTL